MSTGKIIYIDEDSDDIELFQQFIDDKFELTIIKIENDNEIDSVVDEILSIDGDAVITDYLLTEKARVKFDGQALIEAIQARNMHLPCFLLTSHAPDALNATHDARLVQSKSIPFGGRDLDEHKNLFIMLIDKVIKNFKSNRDLARQEFDTLSAIDADQLTAVQKQRLIQLDNILDSYGFAKAPLPDELKEEKHLVLLAKLVNDIDVLIGLRK
ncbi:hypothetical protein V2K23_25760 [Pseudomonas alliivorans]|jgi:hypothetical protein|uniref:hypothetical protein n=1 Tax=Pseudomonas brassicacearum TaxID=930166 RepID=UPI002ED4135D|nr:hypothetical protein [Pseudomonas alliivorans]MEE5147086.1 hypothetical protein [Pseudomonas alliivorans]